MSPMFSLFHLFHLLGRFAAVTECNSAAESGWRVLAGRENRFMVLERVVP